MATPSPAASEGKGGKDEYDAGVHRSSSSGEEAAELIDPAQEKKLLRKIDAYLMPFMGLIYLLCFLDRANIGNAYTAGMDVSLGLTANERAAAISVLYATYVTFECVWPILIKTFTPKFTMSFAILSFGVITICTAWAGNFGGLVALRLMLGFSEAGVFPCIVVYFSMTYRREELGSRLSYLFVAAAISGSFGGLVAYGLSHITSGALESWQWIYVVEGIISVIVGPIALFYIPNRVDKAWFLNKEQRQLCALRYEANKTFYNHEEKLEFKHIKASLLDWTTYAHGVGQFAIDIALYGISTFMPVFIRDFGYSTVNSQLLTVPVYAVGALSFVIQAKFSDKMQLRGPFILANMALCLIGYIILAAVGSPSGVRYFALFIIALGMYTPVGLNVGMTQANKAGHFKRALSVGVMQLIGNSAGAAIGYIFFDGPRYVRGFGLAAGLCVVGMLAIAILTFHYYRQNKIRARLVAAGAPNDLSLGDLNPHYVYML